MKPKSFTIENYRSIKSVTIPLETYGVGEKKSNTIVLVGLNESGKSSILEGINFLNEGFNDEEYYDFFHKESDEEVDEYIDIYFNLEIENQTFYKNKILEKFQPHLSNKTKLNITSLRKNAWKNKTRNYIQYFIDVETSINYKNYVTIDNKAIKSLSSYLNENNLNPEINAQELREHLAANSSIEILNKTRFQNLIAIQFRNLFISNSPKILFWSYKKEYLINSSVDLISFKEDPSSSIPLRNIFKISGYNNDKGIKASIDKAILKDEFQAQLEKQLSKKATSFINKIWKEHNIKITIRISDNKCSVFIEDKDSEDRFFKMTQRSDGFIQFISILLSISAQNASGELKGNIILLDEPETHLHPSGIRYLRDELLKIGKNNHVIIATHSHYMIDTSTPERHFIVSKEKLKTSIKQVDKDASMFDDEVLAKAFGINVFKELLPENIIVVEGGGDKVILSHSLNLLSPSKTNYSIKSAGSASKVSHFASILADENISPFFY